MFKKTAKNVMLICSVLLAFVLVYEIWFTSPLLADGSNSLGLNLRNLILKPIINLFSDENESTSESLKFLINPERVVLNFSGERRQFVSGMEGYGEGLELSEQIMDNFLSGKYTLKSKETVNLDGYCSALKGKSIYVDYGKNYDYRLFSVDICGEIRNAYASDITSLRGYIVSLHDSILNDIYIYLADQDSGNIYKYTVGLDKTDIEKRMGELMKSGGTDEILSYSFELNFHKQQEETVSKLIISPTVLLNLMPLSTPTAVEAERLDLVHSSSLEKSILSAFSINTKTMSKYTDFLNAKVFVENNATLTLHPDGYLDYQTVERARGLDISQNGDRNNYDIYAAFTHAVEFVTGLCAEFPAMYYNSLQMSFDTASNPETGGSYTIYFDYILNGVPVLRQTENGPAHAITLEIENGYLKSYTQYLYTYVQSGESKRELKPFITAADTLVDALYVESKPLMIETVGQCYLAENEHTIMPKWQVCVNGTVQIVD